MTNRAQTQIIRVTAIAITFAVGFLCGSVTQHRAEAQLGDLGKQAMEKAGASGGPLGAAVQLGQSIVDMQQHVDALQKNIDTLKSIKSSLGG
ncbi:MAG TPA: hypothetical protein VMT64_02510 [Candidatus Binataceae bacterium]|nr:hypothetical protein [Candidatus Binataceae bacterium]